MRNPEFQQLGESVEQLKCTLGGRRSGLKRTEDAYIHSLIDLHPQVPRKLAPVIAVSLLIIFDQPLYLGEVTKDWRKGNVTPVFGRAKK